MIKVQHDERTNTFWIARADPVVEKIMDSKYERVGANLRWKVPPAGMLKQAVSLVKSVGSVVTNGGFASDEVVTRRLESCNTCPMLVVEADAKYCNACRCGRWMLANMNGPVPKLKWPYLNCPLGRPGFTNEAQA